MGHEKRQDDADEGDHITAQERQEANPSGGNHDEEIEFGHIRILVRKFATQEVADCHRHHDGSDDDGPNNLGRAEIRSQETRGTNFNPHDAHSC